MLMRLKPFAEIFTRLSKSHSIHQKTKNVILRLVHITQFVREKSRARGLKGIAKSRNKFVPTDHEMVRTWRSAVNTSHSELKPLPFMSKEADVPVLPFFCQQHSFDGRADLSSIS